MNSIPVFAVARSRLQADVMLIRLRRTNIPIERISALFQSAFLPNSVACWLSHWHLLTHDLGRGALVAVGPIVKWLRGAEKNAISPSCALRRARFDRLTAERLEEHLEQGKMLLCVHAAAEEEVAIAWHIFQHAAAELIALPTQPLNIEATAGDALSGDPEPAAIPA